MAEVVTYDFVILAGATLHKTLTWTNDGVAIDLTGYTAVLQVRSTTPSADLLLELTTEGDPTVKAITVGTGGQIVLDMSATETAALTTWTTGRYSLHLTSPLRFVYRPVEGTITISPTSVH